MRLARAAVALAVLLAGAAACTDDDGGDAGPPATGTDTEFCTALRTAITEDTTIFDPLQPTTAADTEHATAQLAEAAPAEIADAMRLLADSFAQVADVLDRFEPTDPEAAQAIEDLDLDLPAITTAQQEVSGYATETCGIDIEAINAASVTTTTGAPTTTIPSTTLSPVETTG
jgi:hypothetical protein